jgi:hypothetical protein
VKRVPSTPSKASVIPPCDGEGLREGCFSGAPKLLNETGMVPLRFDSRPLKFQPQVYADKNLSLGVEVARKIG